MKNRKGRNEMFHFFKCKIWWVIKNGNIGYFENMKTEEKDFGGRREQKVDARNKTSKAKQKTENRKAKEANKTIF